MPSDRTLKNYKLRAATIAMIDEIIVGCGGISATQAIEDSVACYHAKLYPGRAERKRLTIRSNVPKSEPQTQE